VWRHFFSTQPPFVVLALAQTGLAQSVPNVTRTMLPVIVIGFVGGFIKHISGGNWGLQIGVEAVDLVMIIQNEKGMQKLLESNFHVGADASAAAGPVGRHAEAGTNWKMDTEILTYSRAKGVFAGLTLEGASIRQDSDSRQAMYGRKVTTRALLSGKVSAPAVAQPFLAEIRGAKAQAVAEEKSDAKSEAKEKDKN
jgi:lipid-binding SYLF domain-containing protein